MDMEIVFPDGKRVDALYKGFRIATDQRKSAGGDASAPAPFDLFVTSIGTCAGIYVLDFLQRRSFSTEGLKLGLQTERDRETGMLSRIAIEIQLPSGFPARYEKAVARAAELCAVKKHLKNPPVFDITTKRAPAGHTESSES